MGRDSKKRREEIRDLQARVRDLEAKPCIRKEKAKIALEEAQAKEKALCDLQNELIVVKENQEKIKQECEKYKKKLKR